MRDTDKPRPRSCSKTLAAATLMFLAFTPQSRADVASPDCAPDMPDDALVAELLEWIGEATDYDVSASLRAPPAISFCDTGEVIDYEGAPMIVDPGLRAAYDLERKHIFLVRPWHPTDPRDLSVLLHELTHHVQLEARGWECVQAPEWEAYKLQEAWLGERGIDPGFDWLRIFFLSRCPRDIHP